MQSNIERIERVADQLRDALSRDPQALVEIHHTGEDGGITTLNLPPIDPSDWPMHDPVGQIPIPPRSKVSPSNTCK